MHLAQKVCQGHLVIRLSVHSYRSVCPFVRNSIPLTDKVQYLKFGLSYMFTNQNWTVSSSKGCSHFPDITCPLGVGRDQNVGLKILPDFYFVAARSIRVSQKLV